MLKLGPQTNRNDHAMFTEDDARRVYRIIVRLGSIKEARRVLHFGITTMDAVRDCGRTTKPTLAKVREAMAREEGSCT